MKKRGFTLIELIAVIAILMIVFLVASPVLKTLIQNNGKTEKELIEERVLVAAKEYANTYSSNFYDNLVKDGDYNYIYKSDLLSSGLVDPNDMSKLINFAGVKGEVYDKDKVRYTLQYIDNSDTEYSNEELYLMLNALTNRVTNVEENMREGTDASSVAAQLHDLIDKNSADNIFLKTYPIGSVYTSIDNTNPGSIFGGTWVSFGTGKTLVGVDTNNTKFNEVEKIGGSETTSYTPAGSVGATTLTTNQIPSHTHSIPALSGSAASNGAHTHTFSGNTGYVSHDHAHYVSGTTSASGEHYHNGLYRDIDSSSRFGMSGSGGGVGWQLNTTNWGDVWPHSIFTNSAGAHTHTFGAWTGGINQNHYHGFSGTTSSNGAHTHTVSTTANTSGSAGGGGSHTHSFTGTAANISTIQPYITVYMWKRTG